MHFSKGKSYKDLLIEFLLIKKREEQKEIGKCWANGKCSTDENGTLRREIEQYVEKYL